MDKSGIIDLILKEWSVRSNDGLVSGHDSEENAIILKEILSEYGLSEELLDEARPKPLFLEKNPKDPEGRPIFIASISADKYQQDPKSPTGYSLKSDVPYTDASGKKIKIPAGTPFQNPEKKGPATKSSLAKKELSPEERAGMSWYDHMKAPNGKGISGKQRLASLDKMRDIIEEHDKDGSFVAVYDSMSLSQAISNEGYSNPKFATIISKINGIRDSGLGEGEFVFLFLLQGAKSGGVADVDLLGVDGDKNVEVKALTDRDNTINVSIPTLMGLGLNRTNFYLGIQELISALNKDPKFGDFLVEVLAGKDNVTKKDLYPASREASDAEIRYFKDFILVKDITSINKSTFRALDLIGAKLANKAAQPADPESLDSRSIKSSGKARAAVIVGPTKKDFKIDDPQAAKAELDSIDKNPDQKKDLSLKVSPVIEKKDMDYVEDAIDMIYFANEVRPETIIEEIIPILEKKIDGLLVVSGLNAKFYDKNNFGNLGFQFEHVTLNKLGLKITRLNT